MPDPPGAARTTNPLLDESTVERDPDGILIVL